MQSESRFQYLVSYLVNDSVAIDAGCLGFGLPLARQKLVTDLFLTHCHMDHVASLPIFLDNVYEYGPHCVTIHGCDQTLAVLQQDMLNDRLWPDFVSLSTPASPFLKMNQMTGWQPVHVANLKITPLPLLHVVPTCGFLIEDHDSAIAIISDTHQGAGIWAFLASVSNLRAVLLECSFPDQLDWLANKAMHLTPRSFATESAHLPAAVRIIAIHIKPGWYDTIVQELAALNRPNVEIAEVGTEYQF